ncbi:uncharacterized protein [Linepithema humile]|uniref:uncharacterized protein isoform X1 n=1 Tax=Linepithema humile TaxID=83485 RepID=UPI00351EE154
MTSIYSARMKCGYCGWVMSDDMDELIKHKCFATFDEEVDVIVVDKDKVVTMNTPETVEKQQQRQNSSSSASKIDSTAKNGLTALISADAIDELLIETVEQKRPLWDHSQGYKNRTKLKTDALWTEVSNIMGGVKSPVECKKRWGYLRDNYTKARKLMKSYVRSGSSAEDGRPVKSSFRFYDRMQFLESVIQSGPTVSSLPMTLRENSDPSNVSVDGNIETFTRPQSEEKSNDSNSRPGSSADSSVSCNSRVSKRLRSEEITQIEAELMSYLKESQPIHDPVHSFCDMLGDILRRLPYNKRRDLQMEFLTRAIEVEKSSDLDI